MLKRVKIFKWSTEQRQNKLFILSLHGDFVPTSNKQGSLLDWHTVFITLAPIFP